MTSVAAQVPTGQAPAQSGKPSLFSVGYEGRDGEDPVGLLAAQGVTVLVDVRLNPVTLKPKFSSPRLRDAMAGADIGYRHARVRDNPKNSWEAFRSGDTDHGLAVLRDCWPAHTRTTRSST